MTGPLDGYRGIVLTQAWAGSYATQLLGMLGAEVIQVEFHGRPDSWRGSYDRPIPDPVIANPHSAAEQHPWNVHSNYNSVNLNKQCITLDLTDPDGIAIFKRLVPLADFVAENFAPRVLGNLGINYEALCEIKSDIILCSLSAFGNNGPWRDVPGIGGTIEPISGMSSLLGYEDGPPLNSGLMYPDAAAGLNGFAGIVTALMHRESTGEGQYVDLSMQESSLAFIGDALLEERMTGRVRGRLGNRHMTFAPHGVYATSDDGWIALAAETEEQWWALCAVSGHGEWLPDLRFADNATRKLNEDVLDAELSDWISTEARDELADRLSNSGVIAAPVLDAHEVASDDALRDRGFILDVDHPEAGVHPQSGVPVQFSGTPTRVSRPAPLQGQHTQEILQQLLGISEDGYKDFLKRGVTGAGPQS
ncbi:MAG: CoA transferase [Chloroflexi bacterium]|mgnify:CR=1 FL=1|nr:CoA transferase [Chloroflexota bacterium]MBT6682533.1 CoA transferase [Chloroflexota bacterium]